MCRKRELIYSSSFSKIDSILYLAPTNRKTLGSGNDWADQCGTKQRMNTKTPSLWDFSSTIQMYIKPPAFLRLHIFPEMKHYSLLRNSFLLMFHSRSFGWCLSLWVLFRSCTARNEPWPFFHFWRHPFWLKLASSIANCFTRERSFQKYPDQSDRPNGAWVMHKNAQKVEPKTLGQNFLPLHVATPW